MEVVFENGSSRFPLTPEENGYFSGFSDGAKAGDTYKYSLDGGEAYPDPASRFQPQGLHGPSQLIDCRGFPWTDERWVGVTLKGQIVYELHLGTFTKEGTWCAATEKLAYLKDTGITLIEVMPVAEFPGRFGWSYDGVQPYAPSANYGGPDDMRSFVDRAHAHGIGVILDVVYNHLGPDGNYLTKYSPFYLSRKHKTDWGEGLNFDGEESGPVREFYRENAAYWIRDFHLDGFRFDATQDIHDDSRPHILAEISEVARQAAGHRGIVLIGENEPQDVSYVRPVSGGGMGLDALWNDDLHHTAMVALTGKADAYYSDYCGNPQEFVSAAKYGFLYQGQWYRWQRHRRGTPTFGVARAAVVNFIQNHDQIANSARGQRLHELTSPGMLKALTAFLLLAPGTPMLFQGQEFASSAPFQFFADHKPEIAAKVRKGRMEFLEQWGSLRLPEVQRHFGDPSAMETFERSKLDFSEVQKHSGMYALHRDLLRLRREDPVISNQGEAGIDGGVLSSSAFVLRFFSEDGDNDRLLLVNLGIDLELNPAPEPLLAPPRDMRWATLWSSEVPQYGGSGTPPLETDENWRIPGQAAVVLHPISVEAFRSK